MGFEGLKAELLENAESEAKKIIQDAEQTAKKTVDDAKARAAGVLAEAAGEAKEFAESEAGERMTTAKLDMKRIVDEAKNNVVDSNLYEIWLEFLSTCEKKAGRMPILKRLIDEGKNELGSDSAVFYVKNEDKKLLKGKKAKDLPSEFSGGVIIQSADGKVRVDKTFEGIFEERRADLRKAAYEKLF